MAEPRCKNCIHCYYDEFEIPGDDYYSGWWCELFCPEFNYENGYCTNYIEE